MPDWGVSRDSPLEQSTRAQEPYSFQRRRDSLHSSYPRPAQANTSQPNAKTGLVGWGLSSQEYWQSIFTDYLRKKTSLRIGRE